MSSNEPHREKPSIERDSRPKETESKDGAKKEEENEPNMA